MFPIASTFPSTFSYCAVNNRVTNCPQSLEESGLICSNAFSWISCNFVTLEATINLSRIVSLIYWVCMSCTSCKATWYAFRFQCHELCCVEKTSFIPGTLVWLLNVKLTVHRLLIDFILRRKSIAAVSRSHFAFGPVKLSVSKWFTCWVTILSFGLL